MPQMNTSKTEDVIPKKEEISAEQIENIKEVLKMNPELQKEVLRALEEIDFVNLYRIENPNIEVKPDGIVSHKDLVGQWFSPDIETVAGYLRKSQKVDGARLQVVKILKAELGRLHVSKHDVASSMDVEGDNYIIPVSIERNCVDLNDLEKVSGRLETLQNAKRQLKEKIKGVEVKKAVELYAKYLETIFPESKVRDIVWHGSNSEEEFPEFDVNRESSFGFRKHGAVFFTSNIEDAKTRGSGDIKKQAKRIIPSLVSINRPLLSGEKDVEYEYDDVVAEDQEEIHKILTTEDIKKKWKEKGWKDRIEDGKLVLKKVNKYKDLGLSDESNNFIHSLSHVAGFIGDLNEDQIKEFKSKGFDGIIDDTHIAKLSGLGGDKKWIVVFDSLQIHILGSKQDIENFKKWVESQKKENEEK